MLAHVLVPLDGSEMAEIAIPFARQITRPAGKITLLTVLDISEHYIYHMYPPVIAPTEEYRQAIDNLMPQAKTYMETIATKLREEDFEVEIEAVAGDPATVIVDTAEKLKVDAITICTHGRSGLSRWLFGSVTNKVMGSASCPLFVVPGRKLRPEAGQQNVDSGATET